MPWASASRRSTRSTARDKRKDPPGLLKSRRGSRAWEEFLSRYRGLEASEVATGGQKLKGRGGLEPLHRLHELGGHRTGAGQGPLPAVAGINGDRRGHGGVVVDCPPAGRFVGYRGRLLRVGRCAGFLPRASAGRSDGGQGGQGRARVGHVLPALLGTPFAPIPRDSQDCQKTALPRFLCFGIMDSNTKRPQL